MRPKNLSSCNSSNRRTRTPEEKENVFLISHGYYDHAGLYGHLIEHLLSRGWNVAIFDQIGHGLSKR